jgi:DNA-binding NarL/FixJ family response regulator
MMVKKRFGDISGIPKLSSPKPYMNKANVNLRQDIRHLLSQGMMIKDIAEELGVSRVTVSSQIKRMGLAKRNGNT